MLAFFVYDLLGFCAREFPEKSEKTWNFTADCTLYVYLQ